MVTGEEYYEYQKEQLRKVEPNLRKAAEHIKLALMALEDTREYESSLLDYLHEDLQNKYEALMRMAYNA